MGTHDIYSKRQQRLRGEVPDIYIYDELPKKLRTQIVQIIDDTLGSDGQYSGRAMGLYKEIHNIVCREYGVFSIGKENDSPKIALLKFILENNDIEKVFDIVELLCRSIDSFYRRNPEYNARVEVKLNPDEALADINTRFKENGIGYQFESGSIIRVDSKHLHSEVVKPTLNLLHNEKFKGANQEYLNAHDHYKAGRNKECLAECLKSFESVLKIICIEKEWEFDKTSTSKKLIDICLNNDLIPNYLQNQFNSLRSLLESGIPTIRNNLGGHGQGKKPTIADDRITRYALNLTGSNILFLIEQSGII